MVLKSQVLFVSVGQDQQPGKGLDLDELLRTREAEPAVNQTYPVQPEVPTHSQPFMDPYGHDIPDFRLQKSTKNKYDPYK